MAEPSRRPPAPGPLAKLQRRKVVQWSLGYAAVAWALVQGVDFAVATFGGPAALTRIAAVVAAFGLAAVVTIAWYHGDRGVQRAPAAEVAWLLVIAVLACLVAWQTAVRPSARAQQTSTARSTRPEGVGPLRLAILPFENLGDDPSNRAFVGGVHDTLITQVAKIPGLSVISRSSVMQFEGRRTAIAEVARTLDVGVVLEGSVQRDGERLRIQAQLIDAGTDASLWADTFDRRSADLFAVQTEIAQAIATQLRIRLTNTEARQLTLAPTSRPAAYERYIVGRNHVTREEPDDAIRELTAAITIDPGFAAAHAQLSMAHTWSAFGRPRTRAEHLPLAKAAADRALQLDPTLPEGHLALGVYYYRGEPDIERAADELQHAVEALPNDANAYRYLGFLRRWQGRWEEAAALFRRSAELDPLGNGSRSALMTLAVLGRRDEALHLAAQALEAQPDAATYAVFPAELALDFDCDIAGAERVLQHVPPALARSLEVLYFQWFLALARGDAEGALLALERARSAGRTDDSFDWRMGLGLLAAGRESEGRALLRQFAAAQDRNVELLAADSDRASRLSWLALNDAAAGNRRSAVALAHRAVGLLPAQGAEPQRTEVLENVAVALAQVGARTEAVQTMEHLMERPSRIRPAGYWCDPFLRPLRDDPAYRELMARHGVDLRLDAHDPATWPASPGSGSAGKL